MSRVGSPSGIAVDPLQPVLSTVAGDQVLEIVGNGNPLGLNGTQEVLLDGIRVVSE